MSTLSDLLALGVMAAWISATVFVAIYLRDVRNTLREIAVTLEVSRRQM